MSHLDIGIDQTKHGKKSLDRQMFEKRGLGQDGSIDELF
jgi:hypothetical protein